MRERVRNRADRAVPSEQGNRGLSFPGLESRPIIFTDLTKAIRHDPECMRTFRFGHFWTATPVFNALQSSRIWEKTIRNLHSELTAEAFSVSDDSATIW
jgi:hypothetical protein